MTEDEQGVAGGQEAEDEEWFFYNEGGGPVQDVGSLRLMIDEGMRAFNGGPGVASASGRRAALDQLLSDVLLVSCFGFFLLFLLSRSTYVRRKSSALYTFFLYRTGLRKLQVDEKWQRKWEDIKLLDKIGRGGFSTVWKGELQRFGKQQAVAVKVIHEELYDETMITNFATEIEILGELNHPNIVKLIGVCGEPSHLAILLEYCPEGSLADLLVDEKKRAKLNWQTRLKIAKDVAKGVLYLHSRSPKIIHRDIKASNVLVIIDAKDNITAKITDFGLAKLKEHSFMLSPELSRATPYLPLRKSFIAPSAVCGTPGYQAPEVIRNEPYNEAADSYSFGVLLWELLKSRAPKAERNDFSSVHRSPELDRYADDDDDNDEEDEYYGVAEWEEIKIPRVPKWCPVEYKKLLMDCWMENPHERPDFQTILQRLEAIPNFNIEDYVNIDSPIMGRRSAFSSPVPSPSSSSGSIPTRRKGSLSL
ncbi:Tyrosine-protein kinase abl1 [Balamuthia mandrillaris]